MLKGLAMLEDACYAPGIPINLTVAQAATRFQPCADPSHRRLGIQVDAKGVAVSSRARVPKESKVPRRATVTATARLLTSTARESQDADPLILLWQEWRETFASSKRLCREAQRLERALAEKIGFPRVEIPLNDPERLSVSATDARQIDWVLGKTPATRSLRRRLKRDLAAAQARWDAEAAATGLTSAVEREAAADRRVDELLKAASRTPARSIPGVIAKLAIATEWSELEPNADGYPWDFIRGVLSDLTALTAARQ